MEVGCLQIVVLMAAVALPGMVVVVMAVVMTAMVMTGMLAAVWSKDGGKTFTLGSWDYLRATAHGKGIDAGMPDCWMGTMVHSICDRKPDECNGRNRSNLYFTEYPTGNSACWGSV